MFASLTSLFHNRDFGLERLQIQEKFLSSRHDGIFFFFSHNSPWKENQSTLGISGVQQNYRFYCPVWSKLNSSPWKLFREQTTICRTFPLADKLSCDHLALVKYWDEYMFIRLVFLVLEWHFKCYCVFFLMSMWAYMERIIIIMWLLNKSGQAATDDLHDADLDQGCFRKF